MISELRQDIGELSPLFSSFLSNGIKELERMMVVDRTDYNIVSSVVALTITRMGKIKEDADKMTERKWKDWQDAQRVFVANQGKGESMRRLRRWTAGSVN
jgi:DNA-binding HxlR family transcriptional regulator